MSSTDFFNLPSSEQDNPIQEGDAVIIIRPGGEVVPMTFGIDQEMAKANEHKRPEEMTEQEMDVALQGQTLFLLSMAAQNEQIMLFLAKLATTPGETNFDKMKSVASMH